MDSCGFLGQLHNTWSMDFQPPPLAPMGQAPLFLNVFVSHAWQEGFDEFVQYVVARLGFGIPGFPEIFYGKVTGKDTGSNF